MENKVYYYSPISANGIVYSVDMVKYGLHLYYKAAERIAQYITKKYPVESSQYVKNKFLGFHDFFTINFGTESEPVSADIGFGFCGTSKPDYSIGFIKFNPNKLAQLERFNEFLYIVRDNCKEFLIKQWDLAIDIPLQRKLVKLHKDGRNYERHEKRSLTEYLGCRSHDGFTKLYDKQAERNLNFPLTRLELTIDGLPTYAEVVNKLPKISIYKDQLELDSLLELSQNDLVLLKLLLSSSDFDYYWNQLSRRKRIRFEPYCFLDTEFKLNKKCYDNCRDIVHFYEKFSSLGR